MIISIPEAIAELVLVRDYIDKNDFYRGDEKVEAFNMAIKALIEKDGRDRIQDYMKGDEEC